MMLYALVPLLVFLLGEKGLAVRAAEETASAFVKRMAAGINLGNTMDARCGEGCWQTQIQEHYLTDIKSHNLSHVRVPITWMPYMNYTGGVSSDDALMWEDENDSSRVMTYLDRAEEVVTWALNAGLIVVINAHHDDWICGGYNDNINKDRFDVLWTEIADRFRDFSRDLVFEIVNEPYYTKFSPSQAASVQEFPYPEWSTTNQEYPCSCEDISDLNARVLDIIRSSGGSNADRLVVITGSSSPKDSSKYSYKIVQSIDTETHEQIATDTNLIATFHYYKDDPNQVADHFAEVAEWSTRNGIPIYLGEYDCGTTVAENPPAEWYENVRIAAAAYGFAIAFWDSGTNSGHSAYSREAGPYSPAKFDSVKVQQLPAETTGASSSCVADWQPCGAYSACCSDGQIVNNAARPWECYVSGYELDNQRTQCRWRCGTWAPNGDCQLLSSAVSTGTGSTCPASASTTSTTTITATATTTTTDDPTTTTTTADPTTTTTTTASTTTTTSDLPSSELIFFDDFEDGFFDETTELGFFIDVTSNADALINTDTNWVLSGAQSLRIRDDSTHSIATSKVMNVASFDNITVQFFFASRGMGDGDSFWLESSSDGGGGSWDEHRREWTKGTDFENGKQNGWNEINDVEFPTGGASGMRIRFRGDGNGNNDRIYIDDVTVMGIV